MFTGIIEELGRLVHIEQDGGNTHFTLEAGMTSELKIDQSLAHDGCCLTVVEIKGNQYIVTAIRETLNRTTLGNWKVGSMVNLERCMMNNGRFDGHVVQGHVDCTAICEDVQHHDGSWMFSFNYQSDHITVEKGSITINGTSLTVVDSSDNGFSVCIIPYTYENTSFKNIEKGSIVNLEFDILGKYIMKYLKNSKF
jgi:riboflavin synthase